MTNSMGDDEIIVLSLLMFPTFAVATMYAVPFVTGTSMSNCDVITFMGTLNISTCNHPCIIINQHTKY